MRRRFLSCKLLLGCFLTLGATAAEIQTPDKLAPCPAPFVRDVLVARDGSIWLAGEDSSVYRLPVKGGKYHFSWEDMRYRGGDFPDCRTFTALAEDKAGRIWAGTDNRGAAVFNGTSWKTFDVVNALPGEHVFDIAADTCSGHVALATSGGVALYRPGSDSWQMLTRADGLTEDQVEALAYAPDSSLWLAYSCGGLSRVVFPKEDANGPAATPSITHARAKWYWNAAQTVRQPSAGEGTGLPSNLNNALCVTPGNVVVAGTCAGIGYKTAKGTWRFKRGKDYIEKNKDLASKSSAFTSRPPTGAPASNKYLPDDYVSALCLFGDKLAAATRDRGVALLNPKTMAIAQSVASRERITSLASLGGERLLAGTYGHGVLLLDTGASAPKITLDEANANAATDALPFPGDRRPWTKEEKETALAKLAEQAKSEPRQAVVFEGDDWSTQGDWPYSKGRDFALLCAANAPSSDVVYTTFYGKDHYECRGSIGPRKEMRDALRHWVEEINRYDDRNVLISPDFHIRTEAEWDDHGEVYPLAHDGPDVWAILRIGEGIHRVSLYFYNPNGRVGPDNWRRDFFVEWRKDDPEDETWKHIFYTADDKRDTWKLYMMRPHLVGGKTDEPVLSRCRVRQFAGTGVYKSFIVTEPGTYYVRVARNHSFNTILNGVFLSHLDVDRTVGENRWDMHMPFFAEQYPAYMEGHLNRPFPFLAFEDCRKLAGKPEAMSAYRTTLAMSLRIDESKSPEASAAWLALGLRKRSMIADQDRFVDRALDLLQERSLGLRSRDWAPYTPNTAPFTMKELRMMQKQGIDWHPFRNLPETDVSVLELKKKLQSMLKTQKQSKP